MAEIMLYLCYYVDIDSLCNLKKTTELSEQQLNLLLNKLFSVETVRVLCINKISLTAYEMPLLMTVYI